MSKKISLGAAIAFMAIVAALTFTLTMVLSMNDFTEMMVNVRDRESMYQKLAEISRTVRDNYYYSVNEDLLMDNVAAGYLDGLGDPYGRYYSAEEYAEYLDTQEGEYIGVGIVPGMDPSGYILVQEVYPDSPAQDVIQEGDLIVEVDGEAVTEENYTTMAAAMQGEAGTKVSLVIRRENEDIPMEITRRQVVLPTVYYQTFDDVGYLRISSFGSATRDQFNRYYNRLIGDGCTSMVIDLRDNTGGSVRSVSGILDILLPAGDTIKAQYKDGEEAVIATSDSSETDLAVVVLANENTAGTAEVFIQALRDYQKARVVGRQTAGNGSLQQMITLSDSSAVRLTVALYVSPAGVIFHGTGIQPDYDVTLDTESVNWENLSLEFDNQLSRAVELASAVAKAESTISDETSQAAGEDSSASDSSSSQAEEEEVSSSSEEESSSSEESSSADGEE